MSETGRPSNEATDAQTDVGEALKSDRPRNSRKKRSLRRLLTVAPVAAVVGVAYLATEAFSPTHPRRATPAHTDKRLKPSLQDEFAGLVPHEPADYSGTKCTPETRTFRAGNSLFSLTTEGLSSDPYFMDQVYSRNVAYVTQESEKDPALASFTDIQIGTRVRILAKCIDFWPVEPTYNYDAFNLINGDQAPFVGYDRLLDYQMYAAGDGATHWNVAVDYKYAKTDPTAQQPIGVNYCEPSPQCYKYVVGAPSKPPSGY